jgi:hypothetical protein
VSPLNPLSRNCYPWPGTSTRSNSGGTTKERAGSRTSTVARRSCPASSSCSHVISRSPGAYDLIGSTAPGAAPAPGGPASAARSPWR